MCLRHRRGMACPKPYSWLVKSGFKSRRSVWAPSLVLSTLLWESGTLQLCVDCAGPPHSCPCPLQARLLYAPPIMGSEGFPLHLAPIPLPVRYSLGMAPQNQGAGLPSIKPPATSPSTWEVVLSSPARKVRLRTVGPRCRSKASASQRYPKTCLLSRLIRGCDHYCVADGKCDEEVEHVRELRWEVGQWVFLVPCDGQAPVTFTHLLKQLRIGCNVFLLEENRDWGVSITQWKHLSGGQFKARWFYYKLQKHLHLTHVHMPFYSDE